MKRLLARVRLAWRALWSARKLDSDMSDEMRFHIESETNRLMREQGLDPREARRRAHVAFGGVEKFKDEGRRTLGLHLLDTLALDFRLGARMLVKYKALTLIGGFAMAVAIAIGATFFEVVNEVLDPTLPMEDGQRIVALHYVAGSGEPAQQVRRDFLAWREQLVSIRQLSAFRTVQHNLVVASAPPEPVKVAEMTASGFAVARVAPLLGRYLLPADENPGAPPVIVLSHQAWQTRFAADPRIVGQSIKLAGVPHAVVGVMPEGFRFPVAHQFWIPLRAAALQFEQSPGPKLYLFGRLASGATSQDAQAELTTLGQRKQKTDSAGSEPLRLVVMPYALDHVEDFNDPIMMWALRIAQVLIATLVFVVAVNLAILTYARTVTRLGEIAVRTALGASRRRILGQLFVESLALSLVAAGIGLLLSGVAIDRLQELVRAAGVQSIPFWLDFELSPGTVLYALGLAALAAFVMGVLPGLKATSASFLANLRQLNSSASARLGAIWTTLVVAQIAVAVAVLPVAVYLSWQVVRVELGGPGFNAERFVVATSVVLSDRSSAVDSQRILARQLELMSRLESESGVEAVTFSSHVPGFAPSRWIEFDKSVPLRDDVDREVSVLDASLKLFDVYGAKILAGRSFDVSDLGAANAVAVNHAFARRFFQDRNPLGARFRYASPPGDRPDTRAQPWYQIIGVVGDFPSFPSAPGSDGSPTVYHPAAPGNARSIALSVRFSGDAPAGFVARFRELGAEVDPAIQLRRVILLADYYNEVRSLWRHLASGIALVTISVLLLSAAGIYAMMSFTVAQRTREIGIRLALGAAPFRLLLGIFKRATAQLGVGLLVGSLLSGAILFNAGLGISRAAALMLTVATIMLIVGLLAVYGPARRGLRIQPSEALRNDG